MQVSEAEAVVMEVLWRRHPLSAEEVVTALAGRSEWAEPTVKTLLNRLLNKGAIRADRDGRRYFYAPVLAREAWIAQQSEGFVDRVRVDLFHRLGVDGGAFQRARPTDGDRYRRTQAADFGDRG